MQPNNPIDFYFSHFDTIRKKHGVETPKPKKKKKEKKEKKGKKTRGLSQCGLAIYMKKYLKAKERIMETQIFHDAKII